MNTFAVLNLSLPGALSENLRRLVNEFWNMKGMGMFGWMHGNDLGRKRSKIGALLRSVVTILSPINDQCHTINLIIRACIILFYPKQYDSGTVIWVVAI